MFPPIIIMSPLEFSDGFLHSALGYIRGREREREREEERERERERGREFNLLY